MILPLCAMQNWLFLRFDIFWKTSEMKKITALVEELLFSTVIFHFPMLIRWQKHVVTVQKKRAKKPESRGR